MDQQTPGGIISPTNGSNNEPTIDMDSNPANTTPSASAPQPLSPAQSQQPTSPQNHQPDAINSNPATPRSFASQYSPPRLKKAGNAPKKKLTILLIAVGAMLLIGGGSVAAYYGAIVPNKPENKLLSALADLAGQKELVTEGTVDAKLGSSNLAFAVNFKAETNLEKNQLGLSGTIGYSGTQFPYDVRYVDKNIYAKIGGLDVLDKVRTAQTSYFIDYAKSLSGINNKWYVVDRSYWQTMGDGATCVTDISFTLTNGDIKMLKTAYQQHPLFKIKSTSAARIGNDNTTKYDVEPASDAEAMAFANQLTGLSAVKKINECLKKSGSKSSADRQIKDSGKASTATGTMAFYIGNDKKIKKLELNSSDNGTTAKITANFTYKSVSIAVPEGAKPIQELLGGLFGGSIESSTPLSKPSSTPSAQDSSSARDTERQTDINALHSQIEAYWAQFGYYPTLANLNSDTFRAAQLKGLGKEALKDPEGTAYTLTATPQKNAYAYNVSPAGCTNTGTKTCDTYILTATLSTGSAYTKVSLNQ